MSKQNPDRATPAQQTNDSERQQQNPSRASRNSQQLYPKLRNSEYRSASARELPAEPQQIPQPPSIQSPTAIRPRSGMPGTFEWSAYHKVTLEEVWDPKEVTIVGPSNQEPGDTFSSPPRALCPIQAFAIPGQSNSPSQSFIIHPAAGVPVWCPVTGYPGVSMVGTASVISNRNPSPTRFLRYWSPGPNDPPLPSTPTDQALSSAASMSTEQSGQPVPAYPGSPQGPRQIDPATVQYFARLLEQMEANLWTEIGEQRIVIQGMANCINHVDILIGVQTTAIDNNTQRIEQVKQSHRGMEGNIQLICQWRPLGRLYMHWLGDQAQPQVT